MIEFLQKRVSLLTAIIVCATGLLTAVGGTVAWASQFQTKTQAKADIAIQAARVDGVVNQQQEANVGMAALRQDVTDVKETVNRVDDKLDRLLLRGSRR